MTTETPSASQGSVRQRGLITGFVWKLIREAVGLTQRELAELLGVDLATTQSWESGRRPLTALRAGDLAWMRIRLISIGCPPKLFDVLSDAVDADLILDFALTLGADLPDGHPHPLATTVHRRNLTNLITWPFNGLMPAQLRPIVQESPRRRGPSSAHPIVSAAERRRFFDHLIATAERARNQNVRRRQAIYLLSFDTSNVTRGWLENEHLRARTFADLDSVPAWVAMRSSAIALTRFGYHDPLEAFVLTGLTSHQQEIANLNYWAYWLGEIHEIQVDDRFMLEFPPSGWSGLSTVTHLLDRIGSDADQLALNVRTLWQLVAARPTLLRDQIELRAAAAAKIGEVLDSSGVGAKIRRDLSDVAYAIKLAER